METNQTPTQRPFRASKMQRAWLCPPSPWREMNMPELSPSEAAEEGRHLHAAVPRAFLYGDYQGLEEDEMWAVRHCVKLLDSLTDGAIAEPIFETPLPIVDHDLDPIIDRECTPDVVIFKGNGLAIVPDWKFGRLSPLFDAQRDLQLLTYAVGVRNNYEDINRVHVYRFHPRLWDEQREFCVAYEGDDDYWIGRENVLKGIVAKSSPDGPARPGKAQCLYCTAKMVCKEFKFWADPDPTGLPFAVNETLTPAALAEVLDYKDRLKLLTNMMSDAEDLAKRALGQGVEIPGWTLKQNGASRAIEDVSAARARLVPGTMPPDAFNSALKLTIGQLEKAFKSATGLKGKAADAEFSAALSGLIEMKEKAPSLVRAAAIPPQTD